MGRPDFNLFFRKYQIAMFCHSFIIDYNQKTQVRVVTAHFYKSCRLARPREGHNFHQLTLLAKLVIGNSRLFRR